MENVAYNCTLSYGTCYIFGSVYSFCINLYDRSYLYGSTLQISDKKDGDPTTLFKLATGTKPSVSHLRVLFIPCVVRKATTHVDKKALNMRHQAQKGFCDIFVVIPQNQKGYLVYVPSTRRRISIVPGSRWNVLPPGTLTRLALTARQGLKPLLE